MENKSCSSCKYALFDDETNTMNCIHVHSKAWVVTKDHCCDLYDVAPTCGECKHSLRHENANETEYVMCNGEGSGFCGYIMPSSAAVCDAFERRDDAK